MYSPQLAQFLDAESHLTSAATVLEGLKGCCLENLNCDQLQRGKGIKLARLLQIGTQCKASDPDHTMETGQIYIDAMR